MFLALITLSSRAFGAFPEKIISCAFLSTSYNDTSCVNVDLETFSVFTKAQSSDIESPNKIDSLYLTSKSMFFIPMGTLKLFPNITDFGIFTPLPQISSIDNVNFEQAPKLKNVFIVGQRIKALGPNIFKGSSQVTNLFLHSNQIETISEETFVGLTSCKFLVLSNNRISSLEPGTFSTMPNLWSVSLKKNQLTVLKGSIFASNHLTILDLSYNKIKSIPQHVIDNFIQSNDDMKVLALLGNQCNNEIYTRDSNRIEKSIHNCLIESVEVDIEKKLTKEILKMHEKILQLERENQVLVAENNELKESMRSKTEKHDECDIEKLEMQEKFTKQRMVLKNLLPKVMQWKQENVRLSEALVAISEQKSYTQSPEEDCPSRIAHETISYRERIEHELQATIATVYSLQNQNRNLTQYVNALIKYIDERVTGAGRDMIGNVDELCLISNESSVNASESYSQCMAEVTLVNEKISLCESENRQSIDKLSFIESEYKDCITENQTKLSTDGSHEISILKEQIIFLQGENHALSQKAEVCVKGNGTEEIDEILVNLNVQIVQKEQTVEKLAEGMQMLRKETMSTEDEKWEKEVENFELKKNVADCKTFRQIDAVERAANEVDIVIEERNLEIDGIYEKLRRLPLKNKFGTRSFGKNTINEIINRQTRFYEKLDEGDEIIESTIKEIADTLTQPTRRAANVEERLELDWRLLEHAKNLKMIANSQEQIMTSEEGDIHEYIENAISQAKKSKLRIHLEVSDLLQQLSEAYINKENAMREKYNEFENLFDELEETREEAFLAGEKLTVQGDDSDIRKFESIDDMLNYVDKRARMKENENETSVERQSQRPSLQYVCLGQFAEVVEEITLMKAENRALTQKIEICGNRSFSEIDEVLLNLNIEIIRKEQTVEHLTNGMKMLQKENVDETAKNLEIYELKEDIADIKTVQEIDDIEKVSREVEEDLQKTDEELEKIIDGLQNISDNKDYRRKSSRPFDQKISRVTTFSSSDIKGITTKLTTNYQSFHKGDASIIKMTEKIVVKLRHPNRKSADIEERQETNQEILDEVKKLSDEITEQKQKLYKLDSEIKQDIANVLQQLDQPSKQLMPEASELLIRLNKTVTVKDDLLQKKYDNMEKIADEMKATRNEAIEAAREIEPTENDETPEFSSLEDIIKFVQDHRVNPQNVDGSTYMAESFSNLKNSTEGAAAIVELQNKIEALETSNQVCNMKSTFTCNDTDKCTEVDEMLFEMNNQIRKKDQMVAKLSAGIKLLKEEILEQDETKDLESSELKEDIADCKTFRQIDGMKTAAVQADDATKVKDSEIENLLAQLQSISGPESSEKEEDSPKVIDEIDFRRPITLADYQEHENNSVKVLERFEESSSVNATISETVRKLLRFYDILAAGSNLIASKIGRITSLINPSYGYEYRQPSYGYEYRQPPYGYEYRKFLEVPDKIELNQRVIDEVLLLKNLIAEQKEYLENVDNEVKNEIANCLDQLQVHGQRSNDEASDLLIDLSKAFNDKDDLLLEKYEKMEQLTGEMEKARRDAIEVAFEDEAEENDETAHHQFDEFDHMLGFVDDEPVFLDDEQDLQSTIGKQLGKIEQLKAEHAKKYNDLQKKCESCRGFTGTISSWFKKSNCDFV